MITATPDGRTMQALSRFVMGLDLGQTADHSAIAIVERQTPPDLGATGCTEEPTLVGATLALRHLDRLPLGLSYPEQVVRIAALLARPPLLGNTALVIDGTGVGRPVYDLLRDAGLKPVSVVAHAGAAVNGTPGRLRVPKRDLVAATLVALQSERLRISSSLPLAGVLRDEFAAFRMRLSASGHDSYGAAPGAHDDLVFSVALAVWFAQRQDRRSKALSRQPGIPREPKCSTSWFHRNPGNRALLLRLDRTS